MGITPTEEVLGFFISGEKKITKHNVIILTCKLQYLSATSLLLSLESAVSVRLKHQTKILLDKVGWSNIVPSSYSRKQYWFRKTQNFPRPAASKSETLTTVFTLHHISQTSSNSHTFQGKRLHQALSLWPLLSVHCALFVFFQAQKISISLSMPSLWTGTK